MSTATQQAVAPRAAAPGRALPAWWPLAALTLLAAALRLGTLGLQSFWYDEAFTPVSVLHPSLFATLHQLTRTENSPPLWYIVEWVFYRLFGTGEWALRMPSALAGIALVPVAWGVGRELAGRATAVATAALVAVGPIFVWYSQEARVYGLYTLAAGVSMLCFLRFAARPQERRRAIAFALAGVFALLTHYFTVFLLAGMALWLLWRPETRRRAVPALGAIAVAGLALVPLIAAQGGRNTNWIGEWPLRNRLEAIPQYFLTGYNGNALGHSVELLVALPLLAACALGTWRASEPGPRPARAGGATAGAGQGGAGASAAPAPPPAPAAGPAWAGSEPASEEDRHRRGATISLLLAVCGFGLPLVLALAGADYLAPRNVIGAMLPVASLIAVLGTWPRTRPYGGALLAIGAAGLLAITIDTDISPRLQRGDWRGVARAIPAPAAAQRAYVTPLLGSAPLEYYIPGLHTLGADRAVAVREIVDVFEPPLPERAGATPAGFHLVERRVVHGLTFFRFTAPAARKLSEEQLRRELRGAWRPAVIVPRSGRSSR
jgi:mannosyltransferase